MRKQEAESFTVLVLEKKIIIIQILQAHLGGVGEVGLVFSSFFFFFLFSVMNTRAFTIQVRVISLQELGLDFIQPDRTPGTWLKVAE